MSKTPVLDVPETGLVENPAAYTPKKPIHKIKAFAPDEDQEMEKFINGIVDEGYVDWQFVQTTLSELKGGGTRLMVVGTRKATTEEILEQIEKDEALQQTVADAKRKRIQRPR